MTTRTRGFVHDELMNLFKRVYEECGLRIASVDVDWSVSYYVSKEPGHEINNITINAKASP